MDDRRHEVIKILETYLKNAYKNGTNITSYIEGVVALGLYDRLVPLMVREFPEKAFKEFIADFEILSKRGKLDRLKDIWEGREKPSKETAKRQEDYLETRQPAEVIKEIERRKR